MIITNLNQMLSKLRNSNLGDFIEHIELGNYDSIAKIMSAIIEKESEIFIKIDGGILAFNARTMLEARDVVSAKFESLGTPIPSVSLKNTISDAARILNFYGIHVIPILENKSIIGKLTAKRIVHAIREIVIQNQVKNIFASSLMTPSPLVIESGDSISTARSIMRKKKIDHLPVVKGNKLSGIITSSDILRIMLPDMKQGKKSYALDNIQSRFDIKVSGIANNNVITSDIDDNLITVLDSIIENNSTYCIVKSGEETQGIITYRDIISLIGDKLDEQIPVFIIGLPDDPLNAELAKSKFKNTITFLKKINPDLKQAKCRIKVREARNSSKRYEVEVIVRANDMTYAYTKTDFNLIRIFDKMSDSLKKMMAHKASSRQRHSTRFVENELV
jgi:CBS domain-containing protein